MISMFSATPPLQPPTSRLILQLSCQQSYSAACGLYKCFFLCTFTPLTVVGLIG